MSGERLLVLVYDRSLEGGAATREWAMDRVRDALPLGKTATVIAATVTPHLGEAVRAHLRDREFRFVEFYDDGLRRDARRSAFWLDASGPDDLDHRRRVVFHAVLAAVEKARAASLEPALLVLRDGRSLAVYGDVAAAEWTERGWAEPTVHTYQAG